MILPKNLVPPFFREGICQRVNDCLWKTKLPKFGPTEQWALGTADTCKYQGETRSFVSLTKFYLSSEHHHARQNPRSGFRSLLPPA